MTTSAVQRGDSSSRVRVVVPSGMLGSGFPVESVTRGIEMGADAIAIDAGSTDSGPYYLGAGVAKTAAAAIKRDLRVLLVAARKAGIPLVVGSCGTCGTDGGVDDVAALAEQVASEERLSFRMARIYSEQSKDTLARALASGRIRPLPPAGQLGLATLQSCEHIVGLMGHEPIAAALRRGADVVLAGRASDASLVAAIALLKDLPAGPAWHAAKTVECGDQCTSSPHGAGVVVDIDAAGFTVAPLDPAAACTPTSVAAHLLYENADPFRLLEPSGALVTSAATYTQVNDRAVRVEGSRFEPAEHTTIKLEGSAQTGYETMSFVGIADPVTLTELDTWTSTLQRMVQERALNLLSLDPGEYAMQLRCYGRNAILGPLAAGGALPREVGIMMRVRADEQQLATAITKIANPLLLHLPLPGMAHLPSYAFATSPPELERGPVYEFRLNHIVDVDEPAALFRTETEDVPGA
jgi:hypothetical protein